MQHGILDWILEGRKDINQKKWRQFEHHLVNSIVPLSVSSTKEPWQCKTLTLGESG